MKTQKFSYSKLNTYESCAFKYKLIYNDGHFIFTDSLASLLGSLLHKCEEDMALALKNQQTIDYEQIKNNFINFNIPKRDKYDTDGGIYGLNILKEKYKEEFYKPDEQGSSYYTRTLDYMSYGIHRLEKYLAENPNLEIYDMEKFFSVEFNGHVLSGYIDRIFYDKVNDLYIVEDIKTKNKAFKDTELTTPLQFVVYVYALSQNLGIPYEKFKCVYDLPFLDLKQDAGTPGYMDRGLKKLNEIFNSIEAQKFEPQPSPLCHWCSFCPTNPDQPEEGKNLCPYFCKWTRENKTYEVSHKWRGAEYYDEDLQNEIEKNKQAKVTEDFDFDF